MALPEEQALSGGQLGLLAGLLAPPLLLLWTGHGYRARSRLMRGAFWGGVVGYLLGGAVFTLAAMVPPVPWTGGRALLVHGSLLAGPALGAVAGLGVAWVPRARSRRAGEQQWRDAAHDREPSVDGEEPMNVSSP